MESPLQWQLDRLDTANVVRVRGDVDLSNVHALESLCGAGLENGRLPLIVDLTAVGYIDSTGLNALLRVQERCQVRDVEFAVAFTSRSMWRIFSVLSLQDKIRIFPNVQTATDAFPWNPRPNTSL